MVKSIKNNSISESEISLTDKIVECRKLTEGFLDSNMSNLTELTEFRSKSSKHPTFPPPLTDRQAEQLRDIYGLNVIITGRKLTWYNVLFGALLHPFNILLCILAAASGGTGDFDAMGIMLSIVLISTVIRFYQEWKSTLAAKSLRKMVSNTVCVIRLNDFNTHERVEKEIPFQDIVPGDWVKLSAGDLIPADIQLKESKDLFVSQSSLTGEAIPVEKYVTNQLTTNMKTEFAKIKDGVVINVDKLPSKNHNGIYKPKMSSKTRFVRTVKNIFGIQIFQIETDMSIHNADLDCPDLCYMGTSIVSGTAIAIVRYTGSDTYFGSMASELIKKRPQNAFQMGVRRISWMFFLTMACMVPPVLLLQGFLNHDWAEAFLFGLSVAVGLTPEMLPMIVNSNLARGALLLSKKKCIVKNLDSIINMGGMDVLCTDKTGTLTENKVILMKHVDFYGKTSALPLQLSFLNSYFQTSLKNLLDVAVIEYFRKASKLLPDEDNSPENLLRPNTNYRKGSIPIASHFAKIDEIPFDFERRRMSVILNTGKEYLLISKGAVEEMLGICSHIHLDGSKNNSNFIADEIVKSGSNDIIDVEINSFETPNPGNVQVLTRQMVSHLKSIDEMFNKDGIRVVAVAYKTFPEIPHEFKREDEVEMIFAGFIGFLDPPKESAKPAIRYLMDHGVTVKVLTGDSAEVCRKVCHEINLPVNSIVTTNDLVGISDEKFAELSENGTIFAKLSPLQKAQVIRALKRQNHIIGFLGDGINDSPALAEADIGISVDTGTDIAKESADIILLEKDLRVVTDGVRYGRSTYGNTLKYIVMAVSSNFGNVFSVLVASAWLPFVPMKPIHLLTQNLLYDISQISIPWDHMDPEFLLVPHVWSMKSVLLFMVFMGPWSSVFDITTYLWMYFYYNIKTTDDNVALFQTTWFTEGLLTQTLIVHMIRTPKIPFFQSRASAFVMSMTVLISAICLSLPYIPGINTWLDMVHIDALIYPYIFGEILAYCIAAQFAKVLYIKLFKEWF